MSKFKEFFKRKKNTLAYVGIVGGLAILALTFFSISQYEKAKYKSSAVVLTGAESQLKILANAEQNELNLDKMVWYSDIAEHFKEVNARDARAYQGTAIPAYLFSTLALISFGLCLKHADKIKEKEDE